MQSPTSGNFPPLFFGDQIPSHFFGLRHARLRIVDSPQRWGLSSSVRRRTRHGGVTGQKRSVLNQVPLTEKKAKLQNTNTFLMSNLICWHFICAKSCPWSKLVIHLWIMIRMKAVDLSFKNQVERRQISLWSQGARSQELLSQLVD